MRFPGYNGDWETKFLGDVIDFKVTNSLSRENLNYENGTVKNIHYGDIHTKFQTLFDINLENVPYINEEISINKISKESYCKEGDIIFADASEDLNDVGKSIELFNLNEQKLVAGLHTLLGRPRENIFHLGFSGYLFTSNKVRTQIQKESQGSKVLSINVGRISKISLSYPLVKEQEKITALLNLIDKRIISQSKLIQNLQSVRLEIGEKLMKGTLKFKDSKGKEFPAWQKKSLADISEKRILKNKNGLINTVFSNSAIYGIVNQRDFFEKDIANQSNLEGYYIVEKNDFIYNPRISKLAPVGPISRNKLATGVISPLYTVFRIKSESHSFIELYFKSKMWHKHMEDISNYGIRDDRMSFAINDFYKMPIYLPSNAEQVQITNFLASIDSKIDLESQLLQKLDAQKKYFLSNLFI